MEADLLPDEFDAVVLGTGKLLSVPQLILCVKNCSSLLF